MINALTKSRRNIVLIGMPGVGKSTVGVLLAKQLGYAFIDTDITIQVREGRSLQSIIEAHGSDEFCRIEEDHILSLSVEAHVIAPGGSVVYRPGAMAHLRAQGTTVHLDIGLEPLNRRLEDLAARGVVMGPGQTIEGLFMERRPLYRRYADTVVVVDGLTPDQVVGEVIRALGAVIPPTMSPGR